MKVENIYERNDTDKRDDDGNINAIDPAWVSSLFTPVPELWTVASDAGAAVLPTPPVLAGADMDVAPHSSTNV